MAKRKSPGFEARLREILDLAFAHGIRKVGKKGVVAAQQDDAAYAEFIGACHEGYAMAQLKLVEELLALEREMRVLKAEVKDARRRRDKEERHRVETILLHTTYNVAVLRKVADGIAWVICGEQDWVLRRMYIGQPAGFLGDTNYQSVLRVAHQINKDPMRFALMTDLTSFIQVGDLLTVSLEGRDHHLSLVEVKEGRKNEEISEFVSLLSQERCSRAAYLFARRHGAKTWKQAQRMMRQSWRAAAIVQVANTERGTDLATGKPVVVSERTTMVMDYDDDLANLVSRCRDDGAAFLPVDDCLLLGAYDASSVAMPSLAFLHDLFHSRNPRAECPFPVPNAPLTEKVIDALKVPYPVFDLRSGVAVPLARPLFLRCLDSDMILDIVFGRIIVLMYVDFDSFLALGQQRGVLGAWSSKKEAAAIRKERGNAVEIRGRNLAFKTSDCELRFGEGLLSRMLYEGTSPRSVIDLVQAGIAESPTWSEELIQPPGPSTPPPPADGRAPLSPS